MKLIVAFATVMMASFMFAQSNTIEVIVQEEVTLNAKSFVYRVDFDGEMDDLLESLSNLSGDEEVVEETPFPDGKNEILAYLDKNGFEYASAEELNLTVNGRIDKGVFVHVNSKKDLDKVIDFLKDYPDVTGSISETKYETLDVHYTAVYASLTKKADEQASILAKAIGKKKGDIVSARQVKQKDDSENIFGDFYGELMRRAFMENGSYNDVMESSVIVEMVYVFAVD